MFARCARVAPACMRDSPGFTYFTSSLESPCTTVTPRESGVLRVPFAPLMITCSGDTVAVTPFGRLTAALAILDMSVSLLTFGHDAQDFTALSDRTGLLVRHHALRRRHDHRTHTTENLRQLVLAAVNPQARAADALNAVDNGTSLVILQPDGQRRLAAVGLGAEIPDVTFVLQYLDDGRLQLRRSQLHFRLASRLGVADASQQVGDRIGHAHNAPLTSSPSRDLGFRRGRRPRGSSRATTRTFDTHRVNGL